MIDLSGNSWDWRIWPKYAVAHKKIQDVRCQKIWNVRCVVTRASATVAGKVWKQRGRWWFGRKQMTLHYQYSTGQTQLDFIRIAPSYEWQQEVVYRHSQTREGRKTHMIFNLPERKWDLYSCCGKAESSLGVKREQLQVVITSCSAPITLSPESLLTFLVALALHSLLTSLLLS